MKDGQKRHRPECCRRRRLVAYSAVRRCVSSVKTPPDGLWITHTKLFSLAQKKRESEKKTRHVGPPPGVHLALPIGTASLREKLTSRGNRTGRWYADPLTQPPRLHPLPDIFFTSIDIPAKKLLAGRPRRTSPFQHAVFVPRMARWSCCT